MNVLIENGSYHLRNLGDVAILQVAVARLRQLWPNAMIHVLTNAPDLLATHCPDVHPLPASGRRVFFENQDLFNGTRARYPWGDPQRSFPLRQLWIRLRLRRRGISTHEIALFLRTISDADLVVVDGGGYITDLFEAHANHVLSLLGLAIQLGKPTAMLGQGLGPMRSPKLLSKARSVLPRVNLIALRERRVGPGMLASFGVSTNRVVVTGDDAMELAYEARASALGIGIGVNLRASAYSEVDDGHIEMMRTALQDAARRFDAPVVPVPISSLDGESDVRTLAQLLRPQSAVNGQPSAVNGPRSAVVGQRSSVHGLRSAVIDSRPAVHGPQSAVDPIDTPHRLLQQVGRCRIVITGSFHGGVFALGQGIPVVALARSAYYVDKFLGLADQFGSGCWVVLLNDEQFPEVLAAAIDGAWESAERLRPQLLEAARHLIEANRNAYRRLFDLVTSRRTPIRERS